MNNNKNSSLKLTDHARERAQKRNISFDEMSIVYQYGTNYRQALPVTNKTSRKDKLKTQTDRRVLLKKDLAKLPKPLLNALPKDSVRKLHNIILVVGVRSKVVVTAYRDHKLHSVKNIEKYLAEQSLQERLNGLDDEPWLKKECYNCLQRVSKFKHKDFGKKYFS